MDLSRQFTNENEYKDWKHDDENNKFNYTHVTKLNRKGDKTVILTIFNYKFTHVASQLHIKYIFCILRI